MLKVSEKERNAPVVARKVISDNHQILRIINGKRNVCGFFSRFLYVDSLWNALWPVGHI